MTLKDLDRRYVDLNNPTERFVGKKREDIIGKTDFELFSSDTAETSFRNENEALARSPLPYTSEDVVNIQGEDCSKVLLLTRATDCDSKGKPTGIYTLGHDITEMRRALNTIERLEKEQLQAREQLALQASRTKSEFLANMSHEIRTPINGILGLNSLILETPLSPEQREYADGIYHSCGALMSIINDILDISKVEAGRIELENLTMSLGQLISDLQAIFSPTARVKKLTWEVVNHVAEDEDVIVADYGRLRQILTNILSNAFKFTFTGRVTFRSRCVQDEDKHGSVGSYIIFDIEDTGMGISDASLRSLFRPFTQAEASTTRRFGGTGLGLSIAKSLVELMDGDIQLTSKEGTGTKFTMRVPYTRGERSALHAQPGARETANDIAATVRPLSILVVEDNPMNQKVAVRTLQKLGHTAIGADNGLEGLQLLQANPDRFDLVLMDCFMPVMDGYTASRSIRDLPEPLHSIPIVAMTANALPGERENCLQAGMTEYLSKPVNRSALIRTLASLFPSQGLG